MVDFGIDPYTTQYATSPLENYPLVPGAADPNELWTVNNAETTSARRCCRSIRPSRRR